MGFLGMFTGKNKEKRYEFKLKKLETRAEQNIAAYQAGIDPRASMWGGLTSIASTIGGAASSIFGMPGSLFAQSGNGSTVVSSAGGGIMSASHPIVEFFKSSFFGLQLYWWLLIGFFGYKLLKRK